MTHGCFDFRTVATAFPVVDFFLCVMGYSGSCAGIWESQQGFSTI